MSTMMSRFKILRYSAFEMDRDYWIEYNLHVYSILGYYPMEVQDDYILLSLRKESIDLDAEVDHFEERLADLLEVGKRWDALQVSWEAETDVEHHYVFIDQSKEIRQELEAGFGVSCPPGEQTIGGQSYEGCRKQLEGVLETLIALKKESPKSGR